MKKTILFLMMLLAVVTASAQDIFDRLDNALGVSLSAEYKNIIRNNEKMQKVLLNDSGTCAFTEQFILEEMKKDWKISRQNQLLFIWHYIYLQVTDSNLYDGDGVDDNVKRKEEFNSYGVPARIKAGGMKFRQSCLAYMQQRSAEAQQRSAEAQQRSAEAQQRSAEARRQSAEALTSSLGNLAWFYNRYHDNNKPSISTEERKQWEEKAKLFFKGCKEMNMDYKAILRKELGDEQKVKDLLKFYGIE